MLRTIGIKGNIENLFSLSKPYMQERDFSFLGLKRAYKKFLHQIQPAVPTSSLDAIEFLKDVPRVRELLSLFGEKSRLDDFDHIFSNDSQFQSEALDLAEQHLLKLKQVDEQLFSLFSLAINIIFSGPSDLASGGSSSGAIGCIWINPRSTWGPQDFIEFFVHEMTHNLVFLDEYRYKHYEKYSEMFSEENYAISAILAMRRPLDKVFHSILVSTEVLLTRHDILGHPNSPKLHPPTPIMLNKALDSICYLEETPNVRSLLTTRGKDLVMICKERLKEINCSLNSPEELAAVPDLNHTVVTSELVN